MRPNSRSLLPDVCIAWVGLTSTHAHVRAHRETTAHHSHSQTPGLLDAVSAQCDTPLGHLVTLTHTQERQVLALPWQRQPVSPQCLLSPGTDSRDVDRTCLAWHPASWGEAFPGLPWICLPRFGQGGGGQGPPEPSLPQERTGRRRRPPGWRHESRLKVTPPPCSE